MRPPIFSKTALRDWAHLWQGSRISPSRKTICRWLTKNCLISHRRSIWSWCTMSCCPTLKIKTCVRRYKRPLPSQLKATSLSLKPKVCANRASISTESNTRISRRKLTSNLNSLSPKFRIKNGSPKAGGKLLVGSPK